MRLLIPTPRSGAEENHNASFVATTNLVQVEERQHEARAGVEDETGLGGPGQAVRQALLLITWLLFYQ